MGEFLNFIFMSSVVTLKCGFENSCRKISTIRQFGALGKFQGATLPARHRDDSPRKPACLRQGSPGAPPNRSEKGPIGEELRRRQDGTVIGRRGHDAAAASCRERINVDAMPSIAWHFQIAIIAGLVPYWAADPRSLKKQSLPCSQPNIFPRNLARSSPSLLRPGLTYRPIRISRAASTFHR